MKTPNWTDPQFVDANGTGGLNAALGAVSGSIALLANAYLGKPGVYAPENMTVSFTGLVSTVTLPAPLAIIGSSGVVAQAHGTLNGADTQAYTVTFSGLVPTTGSIVAYCTATLSSVQQSAMPIPGPPPGHPSYNPNFQPIVGYAQNVDTFIVSGTTTPPNNTTSFELFRTTLTAAQTGITSWTYANQLRVTPYRAQQIAAVSGGVLSVAQAQGTLVPTSGGITSTLPLSVSGAGLQFNFLNNSTGTWTLGVQGSDTIAGSIAGSGTASSLAIPPNGFVALFTSGSGWALEFMNAAYMLATSNLWTAANTFSGNVTVNGTVNVSSNINASGNLSSTVAVVTPVVQAPASSTLLLESDVNTSSVNRADNQFVMHYAAPATNAQAAVILSQFVLGGGSNGYYQYPGGTILQFGSATIPNSGARTSSVTVTFSIAFPAVCRVGITCCNAGSGANSSAGGQPAGGAGAFSTTNMTLLYDTLGYTTFNQTLPVWWFAMGS